MQCCILKGTVIWNLQACGKEKKIKEQKFIVISVIKHPVK